jgi:hypothetical protein
MNARLTEFSHGGDARVLVVRFSKTVTVRGELVEPLAPCYH